MATNTENYNTGKTLVFIDRGVDDYQYLQQGVIPSAEAHIINQSADGIEQISRVLGQYQNVEEVHIISHGSPGCLYLGDGQLSLDTLNSYAEQLQKWNIKSLLLYGCHVAAGDAGTEFVEKLHDLTGAEIAASKSLTGSAIQGGNWQLEYQTGQISHPLVLQWEVMANYPSVMAVVAEIEPNNSIAGAQVISPSSFTTDFRSDIQTFDGTNISTQTPHVTIQGTGDESHDYYNFSGSAGQQFIFDIDNNTFDTFIALFDSNGTLLFTQDDRSEVGNTGSSVASFETYTLPTSGSFTIQVGQYSVGSIAPITSFYWGGRNSYSLHIAGPYVAPNVAPNDVNLNPSSINENVAGGSTVGTFTSTDPNTGNTFTYSLVPPTTGTNDNSAFTIDPTTGQLKINRSPDYETKSSYNIRVRTTDQGGLFYEKDLTIGINDIDEFIRLTPNSDLWQGTATADQVDALSGNDRIYGNGGNDTLDGGDGDDLLYGGDNNDLLRGGNGLDRLYGDAGNDNLLGETGDDILYGGIGNDTLTGGAGSDRLYGDAGNDTFVLETGMGQDTIYQFVSGTDKIQIKGVSDYAGLSVTPSGTNTLIKVLATGETLGILSSVTSIRSSDFVF